MGKISGTILDKRRKVSNKIREAIVEDFKNGASKAELCRKYNIPRGTINGILGYKSERKKTPSTEESRRKNRERVARYRERIKKLKKLKLI